jgi:hypothetical protein
LRLVSDGNSRHFLLDRAAELLRREVTIIKHRLGRSIRAVIPCDGSDRISHDPAKECFGFGGGVHVFLKRTPEMKQARREREGKEGRRTGQLKQETRKCDCEKRRKCCCEPVRASGL